MGFSGQQVHGHRFQLLPEVVENCILFLHISHVSKNTLYIYTWRFVSKTELLIRFVVCVMIFFQQMEEPTVYLKPLSAAQRILKMGF